VKIVGYVTSVGGFIALIYTGLNYVNQSESFSLMGVDFAVSKGDPMPVILSVIVMIGGLLIIRSSKNNGS